MPDYGSPITIAYRFRMGRGRSTRAKPAKEKNQHRARTGPMGWVRSGRLPLSLLASYFVAATFLAIDPLSRSDWILENLLVALTLPVLVVFHRRLAVRPAADVMLFLFYLLHAIGGHLSYSNVPLPWAEWGFERNHYDRIVHLSFGVLLWVPVRDALARWTRLAALPAGLFAISVLVTCSAVYEILEWAAVAVVAPDLGQEFVGAQGDAFDSSKDMFLAFSGASAAFAVDRLVSWRRAPHRPAAAGVSGPNPRVPPLETTHANRPAARPSGPRPGPGESRQPALPRGLASPPRR